MYGESQLKWIVPPTRRVVSEYCTWGFTTTSGHFWAWVGFGVGGGVGGGVGIGVGACVNGSQKVVTPVQDSFLPCLTHLRSAEPIRKYP